MAYWEDLEEYGEALLQRNPALTLHIVQGLTGVKTLYSGNQPEIDHIFPRSTLKMKGYEERQINHFANFWILSKKKNRNKSNKHPKDYFEDVPDGVLRAALIEREMLDFRSFNTFIKIRSEKMISHVKKKIGFRDDEWDDDEGEE